ncbi:MAG: family 20 glycosylhydrolase [Bacteroidia bacterium]|nr:family 20 glycosylhydrolase [Bacteroidia bacterium]
MEKYINSKGKTLIGWDEILEGGLAPNAIVMSWRGEKGGIEAAKQKHEVIMTPTTYVYFDYSQTKNEDSVTIGRLHTAGKIYSYEPVPKELTAEEGKYILGAQANVWTEYIKYPAKVDYMIFPRLTALSEVLWSPKWKRNWVDFGKRLQTQFKRYDLWGAGYSKAYYDLKANIFPADNNKGLLYSLEKTSAVGKIAFNTGAKQSYLLPYSQPLLINSSKTINATLLIDGKSNRWLNQAFSFNKATGKKIKLNTATVENYPGNGGAFGLVNGVVSKFALGSTEWLGWLGSDMEAEIDLGTEQSISKLSCHVARYNGSRCYLPQYIEAYTSNDGKNFNLAGKGSGYSEDKEGMGYMSVHFAPVSSRYVKVLAKNQGIIPEGRPSAGAKAMMFVDEVIIE